MHQGGRHKHAVADEVGDETGGRPVVKRISIVPLMKPAMVHHSDAVADGKRFELVMRHKQRRGTRSF